MGQGDLVGGEAAGQGTTDGRGESGPAERGQAGHSGQREQGAGQRGWKGGDGHQQHVCQGLRCWGRRPLGRPPQVCACPRTHPNTSSIHLEHSLPAFSSGMSVDPQGCAVVSPVSQMGTCRLGQVTQAR